MHLSCMFRIPIRNYFLTISIVMYGYEDERFVEREEKRAINRMITNYRLNIKGIQTTDNSEKKLPSLHVNNFYLTKKWEPSLSQ